MRDAGRPAFSTITLNRLVAGGIVFMLALGLYVSGMPRGPAKTDWAQIHKSFGTIVLALAAARLAWRLFAPFPESAVAGWERTVARLVQWVLIAATLLAPLSGIVRSISYARPVSVFGLPVIPQLLAEKNEALNEAAGLVHEIAAWTLVCLLALHAAGALKHAFVDRDDTLARMLPRQGRPLIFYCMADCWMSWNAVRRAASLGYRNVHWYPDGSDGWFDAGRPLVDADPWPAPPLAARADRNEEGR